MEKKENQYLFILLCWLNILFFCSYSVPLPLFPAISIKKGIDNDSIGIAIAAYPVSYFIVSIMCGKNMEKMGGKKFILDVSFVLMIVSTLMFVILCWINNHTLFITTAIIIRLLQGVSIAGFTVVCFSLIPEYWSDSMEKKLGLAEFFGGLGMGIGPLFSGLLYYFVGYIYTFTIISILYFINFLIVKKYLNFQPKINDTTENQNLIPETLNMISFLKKPRLIVTIAIFSFTLMTSMFLYPILGTRISSINGDVIDTSIAFAVFIFLYSFGSIGIGYCKIFDKVAKVLFGAIISLVGFISLVFAQNVTSLFICMAFIGFGQAFVVIPQIPLMIEICMGRSNYNSELILNMVSGIFNAGFSIAEFLGPTLGGCFMVWFGFDNAIYGFSLILLTIIVLFLLNCLINKYLNY